MKTLIIDIETRPSLGYVWQLWDQNISLSQLKEVGEVICFAAKWLDKKKVIFKSTYHHSKEEMVQTAWDLIDEADAIIHYNGRAFDIKHLNREFLLAGMTPPSPHKDIDLLTAARGRFKFLSNKLDHVAEELGLGNKVSHSGFQLWIDCMEGNKKAWAQMREYNIHDIILTEQVYHKLFPWIKNHPNVALHDGVEGLACRLCKSRDLQRRGFNYTSAGKYRKVVCNKCGTWSSASKREPNISAPLKALS
jgi:DNA polymerase elongation subunit (family B)